MAENSTAEPGLLYDLRVVYAEITGTATKRVAIAQFTKDFQEYYSALKDLYIIIKHRIKEDKKKDTTNFATLDKKCIDTFKKYEMVFQGKDKDPEGVTEISNILGLTFDYLLRKMKEADMFGSSYYEMA